MELALPSAGCRLETIIRVLCRTLAVLFLTLAVALSASAADGGVTVAYSKTYGDELGGGKGLGFSLTLPVSGALAVEAGMEFQKMVHPVQGVGSVWSRPLLATFLFSPPFAPNIYAGAGAGYYAVNSESPPGVLFVLCLLWGAPCHAGSDEVAMYHVSGGIRIPIKDTIHVVIDYRHVLRRQNAVVTRETPTGEVPQVINAAYDRLSLGIGFGF